MKNKPTNKLSQRQWQQMKNLDSILHMIIAKTSIYGKIMPCGGKQILHSEFD